MTLSNDDFESRLTGLAPSLSGWGDFVVDKLSQLVRAQIGEERYAAFFKIKPYFRLKDIKSAVKKQEKKKYDNPLDKMTDLVGARFVVLLRSDLDILEKAIADYSGWVARLDRHHDYETNLDPEVFNYQSAHYLIISPSKIERNGVLIPANTVCELQLRTLLQHAYAEVAHDRIYKSPVPVSPAARRLIARSMALMEATDQMFCDAVRELDQITADRVGWVFFLNSLYKENFGREPAEKYEIDLLLVLDTYRHLLESAKKGEILSIVSKPFIKGKISERLGNDLFFQSPVCIICYWLIKNHHVETLQLWPVEYLRGGVEKICSDFGKAF